MKVPEIAHRFIIFIFQTCKRAAWLVLKDHFIPPCLKLEDVHHKLKEIDDKLKPASWPGKIAGYFCKTVLNFLLSAFFVFLLYLIYFHPYSLRPRVDTAVIADFDLINTTAAAGGTTLRYDFSLDVTFYNGNILCGVHFDHLTVAPYFNGTKIGPPDDMLPASLSVPSRRHKKVHPALRGRASNVSAALAEEFAKEHADGTFTVDVRLKATLTYKAWWLEKFVYYYVYHCWLNFPAAAAPNKINHTAAIISGVKCHPSKSN